MNQVTFMRRCVALAAVPNSGGYNKAKEEITKGRHHFESEESDKLFGAKFLDAFKADNKHVRAIQEHFEIKPNPKTNDNQPFRGARGGNNSTPTGRGQSTSRGGSNKRAAGASWNPVNPTPKRGRGFLHSKYFASSSKPCSSWSLEALSSSSWERLSHRGENKTFSKKLGSDLKRPINYPNGSGPKNSIPKEACSNKASKEDIIFPRGNQGNRGGNQENALERSNSTSPTKQQPVCFEHIHSTQEGRLPENNNKFKRVEQPDRVLTFQNGDSQGCQSTSQERRLDGQDRPQRRLLESSHIRGVPGLPMLRLGGEKIQVSCPPIRSWAGPQTLHQTDESPNISLEETGIQNSHLSGRHVASGKQPPRDFICKGHVYFPIGESRSNYQLGEVKPDSPDCVRIPRNRHQLTDHDYASSNAEISGTHKVVCENEKPKALIPEVSVQGGRETKSNISSYLPGTSANKRTPAMSDPIPTKREDLRVTGDSRLRGNQGTQMVDYKSTNHSKETNIPDTPRSPGADSNRRLKNSMGSSQGRWGNHRRSMVPIRTYPTHQRAGASGCRTSPENVLQRTDPSLSPLTDRQNNRI